ncbi:MAG: HEAT repeat domain-containing protein [Planctomycetaceae bacterium]
MTPNSQHTVPESNGSQVSRPEELPPVTPPSAGFIVQLFLIPALIVMAVVAVWALFGKLAHSENDWTQLITDIRSNNELRRWPAAEVLAQLLRNEELSPPIDHEPLAKNPVVAESLTELLSESLASTSGSDEDIRHQEFLARMLGALDADDKTLPVLAEVLTDSHDNVVRKSSLMAIALIAGRHFDKATGYSDAIAAGLDAPAMSERHLPLEAPTISDRAVLEQIRRAAQDPDVIVRHLAAYTLGNVSGPESLKILRVMLSDSNRQARANAAIGLARNGSVDAVPTLIQLLTSSLKPFNFEADAAPEHEFAAESGSSLKSEPTPLELQQAETRYHIEESQIARNCLTAVSDLWPQIDPESRTMLLTVVKKIADEFPGPDAGIRQQAADLLTKIDKP